MGAQVAFGIVNIYQILVLVQFQQKIARKDEPFLNGHLVCIQLFFVTMERILFTAFLSPTIGYVKVGSIVDDPWQSIDVLQIVRYASYAMEFLFILLPLRHNFVYHNIEM